MQLISLLAIPKSLLSNLTAFQLLVAGGLFLAVAALLMAFTRERRVSVKRSVVSDELAVHMGRIAEALDRIANQLREGVREGPQLANAKKPENSETERASEQAHHIAYSMFGR
jgi:hypothetical protein